MAKQFIANRSGQTPTLDEVPNETIKIYTTEADLDADLANLEENEIVATDEDNNPQAGTQYPVDVVQDGNMNAVTSNAVAESLSYSTTEQATGGVWIDGKPIYRKVINVGALPNNAQVGYQHDIDDIDEFTTIRGIAKSSTLSLPIPFIERNGTTNIQLYASASGFTVSTNYDASSYAGKFIFEYTKTTD